MNIKYQNKIYHSFKSLALALVDNEPELVKEYIFDRYCGFFTIKQAYDFLHDPSPLERWRSFSVRWLINEFLKWYDADEHFNFSDIGLNNIEWVEGNSF